MVSAKVNTDALRQRFRINASSRSLPRDESSGEHLVAPWIAYRDEKGNQWCGLGRRPRWVRDYISVGSDLDLLRVQSSLEPT
ncbi:MAG: H-NS histone family protein [Proteobacteria bacterium]|nr:H-NS histone family protein [Pseudomonadota bacterium]